MTGRLASHVPGYSRTQNYYDLGFIASWERDLFGGWKKELRLLRVDPSQSRARTQATIP